MPHGWFGVYLRQGEPTLFNQGVGGSIPQRLTSSFLQFRKRSLSSHAGPRCRGGTSRKPSVVLPVLSPVCCAPARTLLGTIRLAVGPSPRLPRGPGCAPIAPTRTRREPTWPEQVDRTQ